MNTNYGKLCMLIAGIIIMLSTFGCEDSKHMVSTKDGEVISQPFNSEYAVVNEETRKLESLTFEEKIASSSCAAVAEFVSQHNDGEYMELEFRIEELLYGYIPEQHIYLFCRKDETPLTITGDPYFDSENRYIAGQPYILIMRREDMLFYDHPRYLLSGNIFIPLDNLEQSTMDGQKISALEEYEHVDGQGIIERIKEIRELTYTGGEFTEYDHDLRYSTSEQISEIVAESDFVLEINIEYLLIEGFHNGNTYICDIVQILKGDSVTTDEEGKIDIYQATQ